MSTQKPIGFVKGFSGQAWTKLSIAPNYKFAYAANSDSSGSNGTLTLIDATTDMRIIGVMLPDLENALGVAVAPNNQYAYVATGSINGGTPVTISILDTKTQNIIGKVNNYNTLLPVSDIYFTPDGSKALGFQSRYCAPDTSNFYFIDTKSQTITNSLNLENDCPYDVVISPDGKKAYASEVSYSGGVENLAVMVLDVGSETISKTFIIATNTSSMFPKIAITPDGKKLYVLDDMGRTLSSIDTSTDTVISTFNLTGINNPHIFPQKIVINPEGDKAYIICTRSSLVDVIDVLHDKEIGTFDSQVNNTEDMILLKR